MGKRFSTEFKQEAVKLIVQQGLTVKQAATDLGIGKSTLDNWLRRYREHEQNPNILGESELAELKRLRKEVRVLRFERDLLKKTTVFFAKDSGEGSNS
jgi:transposase